MSTCSTHTLVGARRPARFRWVIPGAVFAAVCTFGVPEARNTTGPLTSVKHPIALRYPVPPVPTEQTLLCMPGIHIAVSLGTSCPRASRIIRVDLFQPPEFTQPGKGVKVHLGDMRRRARLFDPLVLDAASRHQVAPALVKAIIMAESAYNPLAISQKGARGLMQLMPETARDLGVEDTFNPAHNINGGVRYIKQLLVFFKDDLSLALAAYNAGLARVLEYRGVPPFQATRDYVQKVLAYYEHFLQSEARGKESA